jgi:hypothetical protein
MPKNKDKGNELDTQNTTTGHEFSVQIQESDEFGNKMFDLYRFIRFGGVLHGSFISDIANNHVERPYSETQLLADAQTFVKLAKRLRKEAERLAVKRGEGNV